MANNDTFTHIFTRILRGDIDWCSHLYKFKQFQQILIQHIDAAMRPRYTDTAFCCGAVYINIAPHRVACSQPVVARLAAGEPQNAGEYPVAIGILQSQRRGINFAAGPTPFKYGINRLARPYFGADHMLAARCAVAIGFFAGAV